MGGEGEGSREGPVGLRDLRWVDLMGWKEETGVSSGGGLRLLHHLTEEETSVGGVPEDLMRGLPGGRTSGKEGWGSCLCSHSCLVAALS